MSFIFNDENLLKIEALKKRYPSPKALCLPCLWMAQHQEGFISIDAIDVISEKIGIPPMEIYRVVTFYTMFHLEPQDKINVQVCKTLSCKLCGSDEILKHLEDKDVNIQHVECLGSCGTAPVMQIDDIYYEDLTPAKVDTILKELR
ncbi:MAG: NAD(P)H-dependent oxidoreductase subunit E [Sulfurovum sp.]|uniref:NADH-quinone oxidoreductase subunit NuoE family protein n=1 Tax=Sulfurovum sp. TaxID=1969726 RepID=UPI00286839AC|nr:NAD(P)H-dependent oxidoreductase subunit E [Sulfurovum sp.]MCO4844702.1 NAD(P)H-dependent oxidoreductase subunit E [Sulfurovum sp.]